MSGIVPEIRQPRHRTRSAIASQFWESVEHSSRSIDGQVWELPCEPPALNLTGCSGLSRSQQLIAAQALGAPVVPSFDGNSDGVVLDRVMAKVGGNRWWTAIGGRIKAQRLYKSMVSDDRSGSNARGAMESFKDLQNYALCARSRIQFAPNITFNTTLELPHLDLMSDHGSSSQRLEGSTAIGTPRDISRDSESEVNRNSRDDIRKIQKGIQDELAIHASLRTSLPGHDLTATLGRNLDYVDSSGEYARVPLAASVDLSSHDRSDGLQYRVGLHQVSAPLTETDSRMVIQHQQLRTVLHAQGAVAVEGEAYVWKRSSNIGAGNSSSAKKRSIDSSNSSLEPENGNSRSSNRKISKEPLEHPSKSLRSTFDTREATQETQNNEELETHEVSEKGVSRVAKVVASAVAADSGKPRSKKNGDSEQSAMSESSPQVTNDEIEDNSSASKNPAPLEISKADLFDKTAKPLETFIKPLEKIGETLHITEQDTESKLYIENKSSREEEDEKVIHRIDGDSQLIPFTAESVRNAISESLEFINHIKDNVNRLTGDVQDGSLQRLSDQLSRKATPRQWPYSVLLAQPHIKLNAAMGCLARMPLPPFMGLASMAGPSNANYMVPMQPVREPTTSFGREASTTSIASRGSFSSQLAEVWEPYLKGTALRVFASAGISGQLGRFTKPFLDYSSAAARIDLGLTSSHFLGTIPGAAAAPNSLNVSSRPDKHRAFAIEGRGNWHALSISLAQQIYGPVRARADFRFALDPTHVPLDRGDQRTVTGLVKTALSLRPSLLESVYGADVVLPGTEGMARIAMWWSPKRKEAMAELRLF